MLKKIKLILVVFGTSIVLQPLHSVSASSRIVQSLIVKFPENGRVIVQAKEEIGKNPRIVLTSQRTGKVLLDYAFQESEDWLKPQGDGVVSDPFLRFRIIHSKGFPTPLILAVGVSPGGSDSGFWGGVIGEVSGRLKVLTPHELLIHIQGGFYIGYLNKTLSYGLVSWNFIWGNESHYDNHSYKVDVYTLQGDHFVRQREYVSAGRYTGNGVNSLRELGIFARDLRSGIPKVREYIE